MLITVKTLTGKEIKIRVEPTESVVTVKEYIEEKEGISPSQQRLIYEGRKLDDNKSLEECNVREGACLHLVLTLRGGC
ncbi:NEDD8 family protein RUB1 [Ascoidea rubescens DSM 1968]|uniref:Neural cell expressed, developmentally down-regulated 8 n=1 Tax=Ascoidea rubescens DSM 1968 TaxID=1344418 RepID=A0A1D2VEC8_9ASCO|nr:neural precursor cell expressed, developmentally down-regulated 8 [Ascoidea rubescens DSM 1968]ODV59853.1 neural precursor cell expressed, developmentally down-regulated 8 [Ascoidea rubescens DSM 1968]